jgi:hypothetical protein
MTVLNETWPLSLREGQRWRILGNVILKRKTVCNATEVMTNGNSYTVRDFIIYTLD